MPLASMTSASELAFCLAGPVSLGSVSRPILAWAFLSSAARTAMYLLLALAISPRALASSASASSFATSTLGLEGSFTAATTGARTTGAVGVEPVLTGGGAVVVVAVTGGGAAEPEARVAIWVALSRGLPGPSLLSVAASL